MNVCFIPVRKNSRRVSRKNFRFFSGGSLVDIAVKSALASEIFDNIVVGTDDDQLDLSAFDGSAVEIYVRPEEAADQERFLIEVVQEFVLSCGLDVSDTLVVRLATNPFCGVSDLRDGMRCFRSNGGLGVASFSENKIRSHLIFSAYDGLLQPRDEEAYNKSTKSDAGEREYFFNEGFVMDFVGNWMSRQTLVPVPVTGIFCESPGFFIDSEEDFKIAQKFYDVSD